MPSTAQAVTARPAAPRATSETRVIAVLRAGHASEYGPVVEALLNGGVLSIELTLSTPGVFEELPRLQQLFGNAAEIGVGTVTSADEAQRALDLGAAYIVTPVMDPDTVGICAALGVPVFPGGLTPTELHTGWKLGATAVKLFPASTVGPGYISQLRGPFPQIDVIPSGGVGIDDAPAWIEAGALAVSLGSPLLGDAFKGGDLKLLTGRARRVRALVDEAGTVR